MTQSELILEYIDGTLDGGAEQTLFEDMVQHPELRSELRQYISIGEAVRADREAFAPPAHIERSLMAGLGLSPLAGTIGGGGASAVATGAAGVAAKVGMVKLWSLVTGFVIGVLLAGTTVYLVTGGGESTTTGSSTSVSSTQGAAGNNALAQQNISTPAPSAVAPNQSSTVAVNPAPLQSSSTINIPPSAPSNRISYANSRNRRQVMATAVEQTITNSSARIDASTTVSSSSEIVQPAEITPVVLAPAESKSQAQPATTSAPATVAPETMLGGRSLSDDADAGG